MSLEQLERILHQFESITEKKTAAQLMELVVSETRDRLDSSSGEFDAQGYAEREAKLYDRIEVLRATFRSDHTQLGAAADARGALGVFVDAFAASIGSVSEHALAYSDTRSPDAYDEGTEGLMRIEKRGIPGSLVSIRFLNDFLFEDEKIEYRAKLADDLYRQSRDVLLPGSSEHRHRLN